MNLTLRSNFEAANCAVQLQVCPKLYLPHAQGMQVKLGCSPQRPGASVHAATFEVPGVLQAL